MKQFRSFLSIGGGVVVVLLVLATSAAVMPSAQSRDTDSVQALRELVAEVRGLRTVIERYTEGQAQVQSRRREVGRPVGPSGSVAQEMSLGRPSR